MKPNLQSSNDVNQTALKKNKIHNDRTSVISQKSIISYSLAISVGLLLGTSMTSKLTRTLGSNVGNAPNNRLRGGGGATNTATSQSMLLSRRLDECAQKLDQHHTEIFQAQQKRIQVPTAGICTIVKDSLFYIDEWVDYHLALGFETIYIYDNSDNFELNEWSQLRSNSRIQVQHYPGLKRQIPSNEHCVKMIREAKHQSPMNPNHSNQHHKEDHSVGTNSTSSKKSNLTSMKFQYHKWIGIFDLDEFIVFKNPMQQMSDYQRRLESREIHPETTMIVDLLERTVPENRGGLALNWQLFYFDPQDEDTWSYNARPVTQRFQNRVLHSLHDKNVKTIVRTDMIKKTNTHNHYYKHNARTVDTSGNRTVSPTGIHVGGPSDIASIHHYRTKSIEEYQSKCSRGDAIFGPNRANEIDPEKRKEHTKHQNSWSSCWTKDEIKELFQVEISTGGGTVHDDSAWEFLKTYVPAYKRYERLR